MNVSPICEHKIEDFKAWTGHRQCKLRAEWRVLDKTTGKFHDRCRAHLPEVFIPGHTFSIFPARSYAKKDGVGMTVGEARKKRVCRICGKPGNPIQRPDGSMNTFVLGYGYEHAHEDCLGKSGYEELEKQLLGKGPFRGD